ncbi:MAG: hypothetical protein GF310_01560 [candidate division Zixibacteria bacterium]|nr:hypothetical protein [candidate division Zixibacteria bacterium]
MKIIPYNEASLEDVKAFNHRMKKGGSTHKIPEDFESGRFAEIGNGIIDREYILALDGSNVRGGYTLKYQDYRINQKDGRLALMQPPVSEELVDSSFRGVGKQLIEELAMREPMLLVSGIRRKGYFGPELFHEIGWPVLEIPFYFKIRNAFGFLRNISYLRDNIFKKTGLDLAALSGLGWLGLKILNLFKYRKTLRTEDSNSEMVDAFGQWADDLWEVSRNGYIMSAVRDSNLLNTLYPSSDERFIRLRVSFGKNNVGWAVLLSVQLKDHDSYGSMKLGSIVNCLSLPGFEEYVIEQATKILKTLDVDLIVTNQSYKSWRRAMNNCGFMQGPSNFFIAMSPPLARLLEPLQKHLDLIHINRADRSF